LAGHAHHRFRHELGDAICRAADMTQRTDIASVLDWLEQEFSVTPA
jgi:hypothetical protein